jgi:23S rRNA pseudouridine1911/1915/1917 synthase
MHLNSGYIHREVLRPGRLSSQAETVLLYLARWYAHSSTEEWQQRLDDGQVTLDGHVMAGPEHLRPGQVLAWQRPPWREPDAPLSYTVAYEDPDLLAVIKPSGLPTLPGGGFLDHTLLHQVRAHFPGASPLHRLGRGTSGLVLFARSGDAASRLSSGWRDHEVQKTYLALAVGNPAQDHYEIATPIGPVAHPRLGTVHAAQPGGKASLSLATVVEHRPGQALLSVEIRTGRPHQIRIHLASIGHPLVGDPLYAAGGLPIQTLPGLPGDGGYFLHAYRLAFTHPTSGAWTALEAPPPVPLQTAEISGFGAGRRP